MKLETEGIEIVSQEQQNTGLWDMAFLWFCANVAVPRLLMGGSLASLGLKNAMLMLIIGNLIVIFPLLALGAIGYKIKVPTMPISRMAFGIKGSYLPSVANGIQLMGWGAAVTVVCGSSIDSIVSALSGYSNITLWIIVTGIVQLLITAYGFRSITWLQRASTPLLVGLSFYVAYLVIKMHGFANLMAIKPASVIGLGVALDILAANAFAWGPMVCDYTRYAKDKTSAGWGTLIGSLVGAAGFMFVGVVSGLATGDPNPSMMLVKLGLGVPALLIIVLSSVTTNVMNLYSSAISFVNVAPETEPWKIIVPVGVIATVVALIPGLIGYFINFLTFVGSIFVPFIAIILADYYVIKKENVNPSDLLVLDSSSEYWFNNGYNKKAISIWLAGVALFYLIPKLLPTLGSTVPTFILTFILYVSIVKQTNKSA